MEKKSVRNPSWNREEIMLALNLYFQLSGKGEEPNNIKVIGLSKTLNQLASAENKNENFRNPNGVSLKLQNLRYFDPNRPGGMSGGSKLDNFILKEFYHDRELLKAITDNIILFIDKKIEFFDDVDLNLEVKEGRRLQKLHFYIERDRKIVERKKKSILIKNGKLECEVCQFDFYNFYGPIGENFIECHHVIPLHQYKDESITKLSDLVLVCSNCHRMLHKLGDCNLTVLKKEIENHNNRLVILK
jgi:5-methylcytosine-specific restriction protein A